MRIKVLHVRTNDCQDPPEVGRDRGLKRAKTSTAPRWRQWCKWSAHVRSMRRLAVYIPPTYRIPLFAKSRISPGRAYPILPEGIVDLKDDLVGGFAGKVLGQLMARRKAGGELNHVR